MYDLAIVYPEGRRAAVEVTAAADAASIEFWNLANSGERWIDDQIVGGWMVECLPAARWREIRRLLPTLLLNMEQMGIRAVGLPGAAVLSATEPFADLGITKAYQGGTSFPGSIYVTIDLPTERSAGWVADHGDAAANWVGQFLREPGQVDVLAKLNKAPTVERHAFVVLPGFTTAPFSVSDLLWREPSPIPTVPPDLPTEVSHVWLMSTWDRGSVLYWSPYLGWSVVEKSRPATKPLEPMEVPSDATSAPSNQPATG